MTGTRVLNCLQSPTRLLLWLDRADVLMGSERGKVVLFVQPPEPLDDFVKCAGFSLSSVMLTQVYAQLARLRAIETNDVRRREFHKCSKTEFCDRERLHPTEGKTSPFPIYTNPRWILDTLSAYRAVQEDSKGSISGQKNRKTCPVSAPAFPARIHPESLREAARRGTDWDSPRRNK